MKKITKLILAATIMAAAMPSAAMPTTAQTITVNKQTANCKQKTELFKPSVDLSKYNKRVVANGVELYNKKDNSLRSMKLKNNNVQYATVTFKYQNDNTKFTPGGFVNIYGNNGGEKYLSTEYFEYDWMTDEYGDCVCQVPVGTYDIAAGALPLIDGVYTFGVANKILEQVQIKQDTTITVDFSDCTNRYDLKHYLPNGEEALLNRFVYGENQEQVVTSTGNLKQSAHLIDLFLKGYGVAVEHVSFTGSEPEDGEGYYTTTLFFNDLSDRYKMGATSILIDKNSDCYIAKLENKSMSEHLLTHDASNYVYYQETFTPTLSNNIDNKGALALTVETLYDNMISNGIDYTGFTPLPDCTFKLYVDGAQRKSNEADRYDVMVTPRFGDIDSTHVESYSWQDWDGTIYTEEYTVVEYYSIHGLPVIIKNNNEIEYVNRGVGIFRMPEGGGAYTGYPGHPQFSYLKNQRALNYGSNCPINAVMLQNTQGIFSQGKDAYFDCIYLGRYGEQRDADLVAMQTEVKYNDEVICNNYATRYNDLDNFAAQAKPDGVITAHLVNENMMVDGLQGSNITDIYCDQHNEDWTAPTLQMLQFKDANGNITDRFDSAEGGTVEFAGGDFNYIVDLNVYTSWFNCKPMSVDVSYAPYGGTNWETLDVTEIPENFYMPGFGYFYRGSLQNVEGDGWFDLKIKLTDLSGNWQEQTISPAFRIGNVQSGIGNVKVGNATEVARYTVDGRAINAPQAGVNIVKMSDGSVKKVWVK